MTPHDLRDYYKRKEAEATRQMVAQPEGILKQSAEDSLEYYRRMRMHYEAECAKLKP